MWASQPHFFQMDRVESYWICVSKVDNYLSKMPPVTIGKLYKMSSEIVWGDEVAYYIADDGYEYVFLPNHETSFERLDDWRSKQLNKII